MSTFSSALRLELIATGDQANTWGLTTNTNLGTLIEQAISGYSTVNMATDADRTLTTANGSSDESRPAALKITSSGSLSVTRNIIVPTVNKLYSIKNATTGGQSLLVKTAAGTGITIPNGETATVICDGTNVVYGFTPAGMGVPTSYAASAITNTPAGSIAATNVQAAINELDTEKAKSGANSDITSLTGLTTPLSQAQGGTGANTIPVFSAYQSSAQILATATYTKITVDTEEYDTNNNFATSRFTCTVAGYYLFTAGIAVGATRTEILPVLYKNGSAFRNFGEDTTASGSASGSMLIKLDATDYVEFYAYFALGQVTTAGSRYTYFQGHLVKAT